jgi:hypothetical protein
MGDWRLGVLLARRFGTVDSTFEFYGERLPDVGDEIELRSPAECVVRARVTGIEPVKSLPIRAEEVSHSAPPIVISDELASSES